MQFILDLIWDVSRSRYLDALPQEEHARSIEIWHVSNAIEPCKLGSHRSH